MNEHYTTLHLDEQAAQNSELIDNTIKVVWEDCTTIDWT